MKIQIIGYSGSGKSTLARILSEHYRINLLYLDNVKHFGNWQKRTVDEQNILVRKFLEENTSWVIDGNYISVTPERFTMCDQIIFLDYNRFSCYKKSKNRYKEEIKRGAGRESCQCPAKFDWAFKKWLLFSGRTRKRKKKLLNAFNKCPGDKLRFKNLKELHEYLETLNK